MRLAALRGYWKSAGNWEGFPNHVFPDVFVIKLVPFALCIIFLIRLFSRIINFAARLILLVAHWQSVWLLGSRDQCVVFLGDSLIALGKWCNRRNGAQRGIILKACDIAVFLGRSASRSGRHGRTFLGWGGYRLSYFFWSDRIPFIEIYLKMTFLRF